jgi:E3 ubiquitin-protein ligase BRE1
MVGDLVSDQEPEAGELFRSSLLFDDHAQFESHLRSRSSKIKAAIKDVFGRLPAAEPEVRSLQERLSALLATEKAHVIESQRIIGERDQLSERLEQASYRYLLAEKKLDRAKSAQVQKLERQATMGGTSESSSSSEKKSAKNEVAETNGEVDSAVHAAAETARREALAASEKRKLQTEQLEAENKQLTEELTSAKVRITSLSDEDYAKTDLYKLLKSQHEDVIKRVNDLEATNMQLREEAQKLQAERTSYRNNMEEESQTNTTDLESQLARAESDLARIRNARDELSAELSVRKGSQEQSQVASESIKELAAARETRITALESEVERLKLQIGESTAAATDEALQGMSIEELRSKLKTLENQHLLLNNELPSMEAAWKKTKSLAERKVSEIMEWEEQRTRINAEKAKADQKYFAAMKAKEARENELRTLKAQNAKSSEIVTQLKDAENNSRSLIINLEKQISESKESLTSLSQQNRTMQQKLSEGNITLEKLRTQITDMKKLVVSKDAASSAAASAKRQAEVELEEVKVRLEDTKKAFDNIKRKGSGRESESDDWRVSAAVPHSIYHQLIKSRKSPFALFAILIYAIPSSNCAATLSVKAVCRILSSTDLGSVRPAVRHSAMQTTCPLSWHELLFSTLPHETLFFWKTFFSIYDTLTYPRSLSIASRFWLLGAAIYVLEIDTSNTPLSEKSYRLRDRPKHWLSTLSVAADEI